MLLLAVVAQALAVVGEQHDQGAVIEAEVAEALHQPAKRLVSRSDLAVVRRERSNRAGGS